MSREERSSRTLRAKSRWFSMFLNRPSRSRPARSSMKSRHRSTIFARCRRRLEAGQALAHHQRDRILDRRVGAVGDLLVFAAAMVAVLQHRREVRGDAGHAARADRLDARLLDCIVDGARRLAVRREAAMDGGVVAGEPKRHGIGVAAQDRHVLERQRRGGSGRRALSPMSAGRSDAKVTSRSGFRATARMQPAIERFSGSAGASFFRRACGSRWTSGPRRNLPAVITTRR